MTSTILATFDTTEHANNAISELVAAGFNRSDIGLAAYDADQTYSKNLTDNVVVSDDVDGAEGAGFGATFGALLGAAVGLAAITIPGIGPIIAAGPLSAALGAAAGAGIGAASGAVTGGITASLVKLGVPDEHAHYYAESLRRGSVMVSVTCEDMDVDRAMNILRNHNPVDLDSRISEWRKEGWTGFNADDQSHGIGRDVNTAELETTGSSYRYPTNS